jgi:hypothetical protein
MSFSLIGSFEIHLSWSRGLSFVEDEVYEQSWCPNGQACKEGKLIKKPNSWELEFGGRLIMSELVKKVDSIVEVEFKVRPLMRKWVKKVDFQGKPTWENINRGPIDKKMEILQRWA